MQAPVPSVATIGVAASASGAASEFLLRLNLDRVATYGRGESCPGICAKSTTVCVNRALAW